MLNPIPWLILFILGKTDEKTGNVLYICICAKQHCPSSITDPAITARNQNVKKKINKFVHQCHGDVASYSVTHKKYPLSSYRITSQQCPRQMRTLRFDFSINDNHFITDMGRREWKDLDHFCLFVCFPLITLSFSCWKQQT